jgi:hypothetical protein
MLAIGRINVPLIGLQNNYSYNTVTIETIDGKWPYIVVHINSLYKRKICSFVGKFRYGPQVENSHAKDLTICFSEPLSILF